MELPYTFAPRVNGQSKLDVTVMWSFMRLLARQAVSRSCGRFCRFCLVGASGVVVHLVVLEVVQWSFLWSFALAQTAAVLVSLVSNYALNNRLTFVRARLRGMAFMNGLSRFAGLCALGAIVNVAVADVALRLCGWRLSAALAGILSGAVCNYWTSAALVWRTSKGSLNE